jgi:hypothetical protein
MTTSKLPDDKTGAGRLRPRPNFAIHAELAETRAGWMLTLHAEPGVATALRAAGFGDLAPGRLTFTVTPNLVPGQPFEIQAITVVANEADPS